MPRPKERKVPYTNSRGEQVMASPAEVAYWESKKKDRIFWSYLFTEEGERFSIPPGGKPRPTLREPDPKKRMRQRQAHIKWLRKQEWYVSSPETAQQEEDWIRSGT